MYISVVGLEHTANYTCYDSNRPQDSETQILIVQGQHLINLFASSVTFHGCINIIIHIKSQADVAQQRKVPTRFLLSIIIWGQFYWLRCRSMHYFNSCWFLVLDIYFYVLFGNSSCHNKQTSLFKINKIILFSNCGFHSLSIITNLVVNCFLFFLSV